MMYTIPETVKFPLRDEIKSRSLHMIKGCNATSVHSVATLPAALRTHLPFEATTQYVLPDRILHNATEIGVACVIQVVQITI